MTQIQDVCFSYGRRKILDGLSFTVEPGECVVLAGPNGSGKSTALSVIAGILKPDSGSVVCGGSVGIVPQGTALFEDMTVKDNLRFFAGAAGKPVPENLPFGLEQRMGMRVSKMSGGMKKQLSIACTLLSQPDVILLDEPCAALDIQYRDELISLILRLKAQGRSIIYVGHEPAEFASFCDKLVFFGEKIVCYSRRELLSENTDDAAFSKAYIGLFNHAKIIKERRGEFV